MPVNIEDFEQVVDTVWVVRRRMIHSTWESLFQPCNNGFHLRQNLGRRILRRSSRLLDPLPDSVVAAL